MSESMGARCGDSDACPSGCTTSVTLLLCPLIYKPHDPTTGAGGRRESWQRDIGEEMPMTPTDARTDLIVYAATIDRGGKPAMARKYAAMR